jgi:hypothetical protein
LLPVQLLLPHLLLESSHLEYVVITPFGLSDSIDHDWFRFVGLVLGVDFPASLHWRVDLVFFLDLVEL